MTVQDSACVGEQQNDERRAWTTNGTWGRGDATGGTKANVADDDGRFAMNKRKGEGSFGRAQAQMNEEPKGTKCNEGRTSACGLHFRTTTTQATGRRLTRG